MLTSKSSRNIRDVALRELMLDPNIDNPSRLGGGFILGRGPDSGRAPKVSENCRHLRHGAVLG